MGFFAVSSVHRPTNPPHPLSYSKVHVNPRLGFPGISTVGVKILFVEEIGNLAAFRFIQTLGFLFDSPHLKTDVRIGILNSVIVDHGRFFFGPFAMSFDVIGFFELSSLTAEFQSAYGERPYNRLRVQRAG